MNQTQSSTITPSLPLNHKPPHKEKPKSNEKENLKNKQPSKKTKKLNTQDNKLASSTYRDIETDIKPWDHELRKDPQNVAIYVSQIQTYLLNKEKEFIVKDYMDDQVHIDSLQRQMIIEWIIKINLHYKMKTQVLFLATFVLDSYLQKVIVKSSQIQQVGITALFLASKHEEIYPPHINRLMRHTNCVHSSERVIQIEAKMLDLVNFNLNYPSVNQWLKRFKKIFKLTKQQKNLTKVYSFVCLLDYGIIQQKFKQSEMASAIIYLVISSSSKVTKSIKKDFCNKTSYDIESENMKQLCTYLLLQYRLHQKKIYQEIMIHKRQ